MNAEQLTFVFNVLVWSVLLTSLYTGLLVGIDSLLDNWQRRRGAQYRLRWQLEQMEREVCSSVNRIGAAFVTAQRLIREESAGRGDTRRPSSTTARSQLGDENTAAVDVLTAMMAPDSLAERRNKGTT